MRPDKHPAPGLADRPGAEQQIAGQQARLADLERSLAELTGLQREVLPLLGSMLDALDRFVDLDLPFRRAERKARVAALRALLRRSSHTRAARAANLCARCATSFLHTVFCCNFLFLIPITKKRRNEKTKIVCALRARAQRPAPVAGRRRSAFTRTDGHIYKFCRTLAVWGEAKRG